MGGAVHRQLFISVFISCQLFSATARAMDAPGMADEAGRERVALVLSGGGARGAAHIGVLKYLEEQRIPVDAVVGTSVGAIIGGLYASGMNAREIETLVLALDWNEMFSDTVAPDELGIRRKQQRYRFLVDIDAGFRNGELVFSTGFIEGQRMMLMLRRQTLPVRGITHFDDLPTPFRAVATDLSTARAVVFENGDLVRAMRASMSIPGVYSAMEFHGTRLVDGGIVQNLPVPVAHELDMDALIAVDVATPLRDVAELDSPFAVTSQVIDGIMLNQSRAMHEQLNPRDVLIDPAIEEYDAAAFDALPEIIAHGYREAALHADELKKFSVDAAAYRQYLEVRQARRHRLPDIDRIVVDSEQDVDRLVLARVEQPLGQPLDAQRLDENLGEIYGLGLFEAVNYGVQRTGSGSEALVIETQPKDTGPLRFEAGFELQETFSGNTAFQLRAALNQVGINPLGAEWRTELGLGTVTGVSTEFYQPATYSGRFFTAANYTYAIGELVIRDEAGEVGDYRLRENVAGLDFGINFNHSTVARIGVRYGEEDAFVRSEDAVVFDDRKFDVGDLVVRFRHDSMNSFTFPSEGFRVDLRWEAALDELGSADDGEYAGADMLAAFGDGRDNFLLGATFESVLSGERFLAQGVALGGVNRLSGFERDELVGNHAGLVRGVYYRYLGADPDHLIDLPLYAGATLEAGNVWQDSDAVSSDDLIYGASVFLALDTFIGPIGFAYGRNTEGKDAFYLSIGTINGPSFRQFRR
ncbi:MAG TPA: patatin-like phospholipase family protein, partial [Gammaproteobacteria bacterium]